MTSQGLDKARFPRLLKGELYDLAPVFGKDRAITT
jgi:hypothetical protein